MSMAQQRPDNGNVAKGVNADPVKRKHRNKSQLGADFVAPDGGWGWLVVIAAGCSNLCTFPVLQQFGLIFRDRLQALGITSSQITTIINTNSSLTSCVGLANGPIFRRFTFRQVSFCGALLVAVAIFLTSIANSFVAYLITFSILYGAGVGITASANSLALNTYFKERRRIATGCSWTATALGPIIMPHLINFLMIFYDVQGTLMLFSAFALNSVACALVFQPVQWHVKKPENVEKGGDPEPSSNIECTYCQKQKQKRNGGGAGGGTAVTGQSIFSSQYLYNADDEDTPGYEIIDPVTPMLSRGNDGWFTASGKRSVYGSKMSLTSNRTNKPEYDSKKASNSNLVMSNRPSYANLALLRQGKLPATKIVECSTEDCPSWKAPQDLLESEKRKVSLPPRPVVIVQDTATHDGKHIFDNGSEAMSLGMPRNDSFRKRSNTFNLEKEVLRVASKKLEQYKRDTQQRRCTCDEQRQLIAQERATTQNGGATLEADAETDVMPPQNGWREDSVDGQTKSYTFVQKLVIFFDLDLLRDLVYVNLMIGVTIANFAELNFSILTPFVLSDFGFTRSQIAMAMSLLGGMDIGVRFFIPFVAGKIGWQNRTFFLFGVLGMALGRIVLAHFRSYAIVIAAVCWIGLNKGLRTVFMALVIPSHVPLDRLPGATGIQLLFSGIFYLVMGPIVGWVRDATNVTITLHCLNITTYLTAISWGIEKLYTSRTATAQ